MQSACHYVLLFLQSIEEAQTHNGSYIIILIFSEACLFKSKLTELFPLQLCYKGLLNCFSLSLALLIAILLYSAFCFITISLSTVQVCSYFKAISLYVHFRFSGSKVSYRDIKGSFIS
jgi:hypothetical protein